MSNYNNYNSTPHQSSAAWDSDRIYDRIWAEEQLRPQQPETPVNVRYNNERKPKEFKKLKKLGRNAFVIASLLMAWDKVNDSIIDNLRTVDNRIGHEVKLSDSWINGIDNEEVTDIQPIIKEDLTQITIPEEGVIRTQDWTYEKANRNWFESNPDSPTHTSIAVAGEELTFNIDPSDGIIDGSNGRIGVRIENLEKTADGRHTGIKPEVDKDGWVFIDVKPSDQ